MNTVTESFNRTVRQMIEMSQWPKCLSKKWPKCLSDKNRCRNNVFNARVQKCGRALTPRDQKLRVRERDCSDI